MMRFASLAGLAAIALAAPAAGQDITAEPSYGELSLQSGFDDDPRTVELQAGGAVEAGALGGGCIGRIASAPDVAVTFDARNPRNIDLPLIFSVNSEEDTTLVIRAPNGAWLCDDDGGDKGSNPSVYVADPASGRYLIWVGVYGGGENEFHPAELFISEVSSE